jgi:hypothetical protein
MAPKNGPKQRNFRSDISPDSELMRGPIGLRSDIALLIRDDLKQRIADHRDQHRHTMIAAERWSMWAEVGEPYGASPLQVMRIADRTNNQRTNPKHYTLKTSRQDRVMWGMVAAKLNTSIKDAANFGLHAACERLGLDLQDLDAGESGLMA